MGASWLDGIGAVVICAGLVFSGVLLWRDKSSLGAVGFAFAVVVAGVAVANLPRILKAGYSAKNGETTLGLDMAAVQEAKQQVTSDKADVEAIKTQMQTLADDVRETQSKVSKSESSVNDMHNAVQSDVNEIGKLEGRTEALVKNIQDAHNAIAQTEANLIQMQDSMKGATREIIEMIYLDISTRNYFPMLPQVVDEMNRRLVQLEHFAYTDPTEEKASFEALNKLIESAHRPLIRPTSPTAKSTAH